MKKLGPNARWKGLSAAQLASLEKWLFEEGKSYDVAWERAKSEFGFAGSVSSVRRFYQRCSQERIVAGFTEAQDEAEKINGAPASAGLMRTAAMKVLSRLLLKRVREAPGEVKEWESLVKLLLQSEDNELRRELKQEDNEIRRQYLAFARERFHFDVVEQAQKALPEIQVLAEARQDPQVTKFELNKRVNQIIRRIFGKEVFGLHPENAEEEAAREMSQQEKKEAAETERALAQLRQIAGRSPEMPPVKPAEVPPEPETHGISDQNSAKDGPL
jgi:hypothetical protein